ncbi:MAG: hypothetical protein GWN57_11105, partial [Nitrospinaceae bacterium]|nr:hypothetical protein [Nitrospinaceae bacterium]
MQNIENQIREYTRSIWKSILGLQVHPTEEDFTPPGKKEPMIAGCVQIMGEWKGTVALSCPIPLARQAAAIMFQL